LSTEFSTTSVDATGQLNKFAMKGDLQMIRDTEVLLADLVAQEQMWAAVREEWTALKAEHLSNDAIERWSREQVTARFRAA